MKKFLLIYFYLLFISLNIFFFAILNCHEGIQKLGKPLSK